MKPIILKADQDGRILMNADEIAKMVQDAYDEGYKDGHASAPITVTPSFPDVITTPSWKPYEITCNSVTLYAGDNVTTTAQS